MQDTLHLLPDPIENKSGLELLKPYTLAYTMDLLKSTHEHGLDNINCKDDLQEYLAMLDGVERRSIHRVEEGGLFRNLDVEKLLKRADTVEFRPGWAKTVDFIKSRQGIQTYILSVNWSTMFIERSLSRFSIPNLTVISNEIETRNGKGTGNLNSPTSIYDIRSPNDKLMAMNSAVASDKKKIYIGDSLNDIACLMNADLGIIMGGSKSFLDTCERVGISIGRVDSGLCRVEGWDEVVPLLLQFQIL